MNVYQTQNIVQNYRITDVLGEGGVAVTYKAVALDTNSPVAIKVVSLKQLDNWKQIELFYREAEILAKLDHPAIPKYIDYFDIETETDKVFYLVQQLAPGKSLFELVQSGWRTTEAEKKKIARQVLEILAYLHSLEPPVIHRDIKPNNLIRSDDGTIYLVDFGAVQNTYYNTLMQGSTVVGTYGYMASEQFRGKALPATDLYSLGATLLYLLTHRSPNELPQDTLKLDFRSSVNISDDFANWLEKLLEPDLEDRFTNANEAKAGLATSAKVKQRNLTTNVGIGLLCLSLVWVTVPYRWFFLSRLGFYPNKICSLADTEKFIAKGGDIKSVRQKGKLSILSCLVRNEKTEAIKVWLENSNDVNQLLNQRIHRIDGSSTLIRQAIEKENYEIVELLTKYGADIDDKDNDRRTPLFEAIEDSDKDLAELFINNGADVNAKDNDGNTPLSEAIEDSDKDLAELVIKYGADVNAKDSDGNTPLSKAIEDSDKDLAKLLIDNGADVNARDYRGRTPLFEVKNPDIARLLIDNGADVNAKDNYGYIPIVSAVRKIGYSWLESVIKEQCEEIILLLIDEGAEIENLKLNPEESLTLQEILRKNKLDIKNR